MHDIFFRKDNFKDEPWYDDLCLFCAIGVCRPDKQEYVEPLQKALSTLGYNIRVFLRDGYTYIAGA